MKILIVDDEPLVLDLAERILRRKGHGTLRAATAEEALKICGIAGDELDLVISDVVMPGLSGFDLVACLENSIKPIPVILMSGYPSDSVELKAWRRQRNPGRTAFLQKPFVPVQLLAAVSRFA